MKTKTIYKLKWKNLFKLITYISILIIALIILNTIVKINKDNKNTNKMMDLIKKDISVNNLVNDEFTYLISPCGDLSKFDPYYNYISLSLIEPNMAALKKINNDTVGFIDIKGIDFSLPVLKNKNYYSNHNLDKENNSNGWIYLDSNNSIDDLDNHTIIHLNGNNFNPIYWEIKKLRKKEWLENSDNYVIRYFTRKYTTLFQIISVYEDNRQIKYDFSNDELEKYILDSYDKSIYDFNSTRCTKNEKDKYLTLSIEKDNKKLIIVSKLLKIKMQ